MSSKNTSTNPEAPKRPEWLWNFPEVRSKQHQSVIDYIEHLERELEKWKNIADCANRALNRTIKELERDLEDANSRGV